ncbi:hypothetical protein Zm00014a_042019 [Zea mays]|uniref:Uncharacterized protein n=1 Tax=Zea mays TaxID=4577 RepID=A0A3L6DJ27_MAIZE|nr:hypothetical protein Zm00014a_042019 [Zea mays]
MIWRSMKQHVVLESSLTHHHCKQPVNQTTSACLLTFKLLV